jgi:deoxyhypusine synthase
MSGTQLTMKRLADITGTSQPSHTASGLEVEEAAETEAMQEGRRRAEAVAEAVSWEKQPADDVSVKVACSVVLQLPLTGTLG